jgi:hypothetical protein
MSDDRLEQIRQHLDAGDYHQWKLGGDDIACLLGEIDGCEDEIARLKAKVVAAEDRIDEILPPLTPDFALIQGGARMSEPSEEGFCLDDARKLINEAGYLVLERGVWDHFVAEDRQLRDRLDRQQAVVEAAQRLIKADNNLRNVYPHRQPAFYTGFGEAVSYVAGVLVDLAALTQEEA